MAGDLPAELCVVAFLGRTVNVQNCLAFCVDESCRFERLNPVIRPTAVVFASVFAVEKRRVNGGVTALAVSCAERRSSTRQSAVLILSNHLTSVE